MELEFPWPLYGKFYNYSGSSNAPASNSVYQTKNENDCHVSNITGGLIYKKEQDAVVKQFELLVSGFCRLITQYIVAKDIVSICQSYYHIEFDKWDCSHSSINYRINDQFISRVWFYGVNKWSNAYGSKTIERYGHNVWKIKIIKLDDDANTLFGIISSDKLNIKNINLRREGYGLNTKNGDVIHKNSGSTYIKNIGIKEHDIITISLDLTKQNKGTLSFCLNDKHFGKAFDLINTDKDWKLAIATTSNCELQLLL